jgi:hypothetical protein
MASDFVSRNHPALPSASVPWLRRAAWRRLWRDDTDASLLVSVSLRGAAGSASVKRRVRRSIRQLTSCVDLSLFPFMLPGKLGKLENLLVQRYEQPFAELFILLERLNLLEKLVLPFLNQIKIRMLKMLKPELLKLELL